MHRYVFLVFEQGDNFDKTKLKKLLGDDVITNQGGKKSCVAAKKSHCGDLLSLSFFETQWDESCDVCWEKWGLGYPPVEYRSPGQKLKISQASSSRVTPLSPRELTKREFMI